MNPPPFQNDKHNVCRNQGLSHREKAKSKGNEMKNASLTDATSFGGPPTDDTILASKSIKGSSENGPLVTTVNIHDDGSISVDRNGGNVGGAPLIR